MSATLSEQPARLRSIDQLRGYAVFGMILVNAKGMFGVSAKNLSPQDVEGIWGTVVDQLSHHKDHFTYADTIAPLFMFVVGISMRLSWLRRSELVGASATRKAMAKRFATLVLIAFTIYMGWLWDALMDIGLAGLLALMFINTPAIVRTVAACSMALGYQAIVSFTVYGPWIKRTGDLTAENMPYLYKWIPYQSTLFDVRLNGGPFGPLSWCFILLLGTIAYDIMKSGNSMKIMSWCLSLGLGLCTAGWCTSMAWGEIKELWPISAYHMTLPFPLWSTGLCFLTLLMFYVLCDLGPVKFPTFASVSMNALFIYIVQCVISETQAPMEIIQACYGWIQKPLVESNPSLAVPLGICGILAFYSMLAVLAYVLHRNKTYIRI
jgi:predicted acyltransferase